MPRPVLANLKIPAASARRLGHAVVLTEQYPKGLGHTLPELPCARDGARASSSVWPRPVRPVWW